MAFTCEDICLHDPVLKSQLQVSGTCNDSFEDLESAHPEDLQILDVIGQVDEVSHSMSHKKKQ